MSIRHVLPAAVLSAALLALASAASAEPPTREDGSLDNSADAVDPEETPPAEPMTAAADDFVESALAVVQRMRAGAEMVGSRGDNEEVREFAADLQQRLDPLYTRLIALRGGSGSRSTVDAAAGDSTLARMRNASSSDVDNLWLDYQSSEYSKALALFQGAAFDTRSTTEVRQLANEALPWLHSYTERFAQLRAHQADGN